MNSYHDCSHKFSIEKRVQKILKTNNPQMKLFAFFILAFFINYFGKRLIYFL